MSSAFSKFQDLDLRVTRNGVYAKFCILSQANLPPELHEIVQGRVGTEVTMVNSSGDQSMIPWSHSLHPSGAVMIPVQKKHESIALDLESVMLCYPAYGMMLLRMLENHEVGHPASSCGGWFLFLHEIAEQHTSVLVRRRKPRFGRVGWNWESITLMIWEDLMEHFTIWYDNLCQPHFEAWSHSRPVKGDFFNALDRMLQYLDLLCQEKWDLVDQAWMRRRLPDTRREDVVADVLRLHFSENNMDASEAHVEAIRLMREEIAQMEVEGQDADV